MLPLAGSCLRADSRRLHGDDFNYAVFLSQYGNFLSRKLASRFYGGSMMAILPGVKSKADIEKAWSTVDRNGDGRLSYQELRPVLRASSGLSEHSTDRTLGPFKWPREVSCRPF